MTSSALLSIGRRAMLANESALNIVGHNIANANVPGYSRQQVDFATAAGQLTGQGYYGAGVDAQTVTRSYNEFLTRQVASTRAQSAYDTTRAEQLDRLETLFAGGAEGLGAAVGDMLNAMVDMATHPQDLSARAVVLGRAGELAARFATAGNEMDRMQTGVNEDLGAAVLQVNSITTRIAAVNSEISLLQGNGHTPNDLLDQRDELVSSLSQYIQVSTLESDDGSLNIFTMGGQRLVLGSTAVPLSVVPDAFDGSRMRLSVVETDGPRPLESSMLGAGSLGGMLRFQNDDLATARNMVGQLAAALAGAVNAQQALGLDLRVPPGVGSPVFSVGPPEALAASTNARDAGGNFVSQVSLTVADARQLVPSEYSLEHDGSNWQLTRLSDGLMTAVASGDEVDGMTIDLGTPPAPTGDRFLLQPLTRAANGMTRVMSDPRSLAAASPLTATAAQANTGTGEIAGFNVTDPSYDPQLSATIAFSSDTGNYTWELRDRVTNALSSTGTGTWSPGTPITLNGFELALSGAPRTGDTFNVVRTDAPAANNGNALAMAALRDQALVGVRSDGAGGVAGGATFSDTWASAIATVGVRTQSAHFASEFSSQTATAAVTARASVSGVNLDEEAARLMQFQQGYQAAAKVLQVAQTLMDTVLGLQR